MFFCTHVFLYACFSVRMFFLYGKVVLRLEIKTRRFMGKRDKRRKRKDIVKGAALAKTQSKTHKKSVKEFQKVLKEKGEEDIDSILAEFLQKHASKQLLEFTENCVPSARFGASFTACEWRREIYLFGGEFMDLKQHVYNDLFVFDVGKSLWKRVKAPNMPPPRSSHQAVLCERDGGELYVFGGEFISPSQEQFKHYKDLWVLKLKTEKWEWEQIVQPKGTDKWPASRSGHRMFLFKRKIFMFGGFQDTLNKLQFFNDLWSFDLETYSWTLHEPGLYPVPGPRGGHGFVVDPDSQTAILYGGINIVRPKNGAEKSITLTDMWIIDLKTMRWTEKARTGLPPSIRTGFSVAHCPIKRRLYLFGGVSDLETNLDLVSVFHQDMFWLQLDTFNWFEWHLRVLHEKSGKVDDHYRERMAARTKLAGFAESFEVRKERFLLRKKGAFSKVDPALLSLAAKGTVLNPTFDSAEEQEALQDDFLDHDLIQAATKYMHVANKAEDAEFIAYEQALASMQDESDIADITSSMSTSVALTTSSGDASAPSISLNDKLEKVEEKKSLIKVATSQMEESHLVPSARRNAMITFFGQTLYVFGGVIENRGSEMTLADMYCVNVSQSTNWETIIPPSAQQQWFCAFEEEAKTEVNDEEEDADDDDEDAGDDDNEEEDDETEEDDDENEEDKSEEMKSAPTQPSNDDSPAPMKGEKLAEFFNRSKEYWQNVAIKGGVLASNAKELRQKSFELAQIHFSS